MIWFAANWRLLAAFIVGALACYPVASCQGERRANTENAAKIVAASAVVKEASAKAEIAAMAVDAVRRGEAENLNRELKEIVDEKGTDSAAGPAVSGVLERLRQERSR